MVSYTKNTRRLSKENVLCCLRQIFSAVSLHFHISPELPAGSAWQLECEPPICPRSSRDSSEPATSRQALAFSSAER